MLSAQAAEMALQRTELAAARAGLLEKRYEIKALRARLARALRVEFGRSSEKLRDQLEQLELTSSPRLRRVPPHWTHAPAASQGAACSMTSRGRAAGIGRRVGLIGSATIGFMPPAFLGSVSATVSSRSASVTELLDYVPGSFRVTRHVRPKLSCRACDRIEDAIRGRPPDQRVAARVTHTAPPMSDLGNCSTRPSRAFPGGATLPRQSATRSRWDALTLILRDGRACIDNSAAERAVRPIAIGRRNWTFAGSSAGSERAAAIYSLVEPAKLHGLDPEAYLRHVLERIADHPVSRVGDLLPVAHDQRIAA